jgi:hypothetical protein
VKNRWSRRLFNDTVILVGLPDHITCGYLNEQSSHYEFEYFDPAGRDGDRKSIRQLRHWSENELALLLGKKVIFKSAKPLLNFQSDPHDVMCQTWIWFWVYFRIIRNKTHSHIAKQVKAMINKQNSLVNIHLFGSWLNDLLQLGYYLNETPSVDMIVTQNTPLHDNNNNKQKQTA